MTPIRPNGHAWEDLQSQAVELTPQEMRVAANFYIVFSTPEGQIALQNMHLLTTWKRNSPNASDGALRESEAQRRFVAIIEAWIARHKKRVAAQSDGRTEPQSEPDRPARKRRSRRGSPA